ncbi:hypothetical protein AX15_007202 [Amanita polypyramis BW_CC]|nr:hypothetical protein AX15_007202 [Amanita polypyramis BW_CC]
MSGHHTFQKQRFRSTARHWLQFRDSLDCESPDPANTVTDRLNTLLNSSGPRYVLRLCPGKQYMIQAPIRFAASNQEISTLGYPTGDQRATLVVSGPVSNGTGHTTAVDGTCSKCSGVVIRNIQIDGTRGGAPPTQGGGNIEMGGPNANQLIEYVRSFDPRGWTCLHVAEGALNCNNVTVQNNDIGPCGSDAFQQWADGISVSCRNSTVRNNMVQNPTDGGIVLFGSPGTQVYNNTIWIQNQTLLGGINLVDYDPFEGDYTGTVVRENFILGGFATGTELPGQTKGVNQYDAIIKIGIAIGPRTWFGERYGDNVSHSGSVLNNKLTGAFSFAIAVSSAREFTVQGNSLFGNTSFIGARGPNCSKSDAIPDPSPFVLDANLTQELELQHDFKTIADGDSLTCVLPPDGGDYWPFGGNPFNPGSSHGPSGTTAAIIALVLLFGLFALAIICWYIRRWALRRSSVKSASDELSKRYKSYNIR